jgi:hypothetical protein
MFFTAAVDDPSFKKSAIDWMLANATDESMTTTTRLSLAYLAVHGVDYEHSEMPDFSTVTSTFDTFSEETTVEALACTVYSLDPAHAGKNRWARPDAFEFSIPKDDIERLALSHIITGVIRAANQGEDAWKALANPGEIERLQRHAQQEQVWRAAQSNP